MKLAVKKLFMAVAIVVLIILLLMVCPWFYIRNININELKNLTEQEIYSTAELDRQNINLFAFNTIKARNELEKLPFVYSVEFKRILPDTLEINITERTIRCYVPYMDKFLYMDGDGRVLKVASSYTENLPIVNGLKFTSFQVGQALDTENKDAMNIITELSKLMKGYEMLEQVYKIDVSDTEDIHIYAGNIDIVFGSFDDANLKVSRIKPILEQLSDNPKGFLYLDDPERSPVFEYMK